MARRIMFTAATLCLLFDIALAQSNAPAKTAAAAKKGARSSCAAFDIGCAKCSSTTKRPCLACSVNGPVAAALNDLGRCACPAGTARAGSANTVNLPLGGAAKVASSSSSKGGKKAVVVDVACAPCAEDAYATIARPVGVSKCVVCPAGTTTKGDIGSTACFVAPGQWFNVATQTAEPCPVDQYCLGGDIANVGKLRQPCPVRSTTQGATGSAELGDCFAAPGNYADAVTGAVKVCPQGSYCAGGSVRDERIFACPLGSTTLSTGASQLGDCTVGPGYYCHPATSDAALVCFFDSHSPKLFCTADFYCSGGSVLGAGAVETPCPTKSSTVGATGRSSLSDCQVEPGQWYNPATKTVEICPQNSVCLGGSVMGAGAVASPCPPSSASAAGSSALSACRVAPGSYLTAGGVVPCDPSFYCAGGPVDGAGMVARPCPTWATSAAGASTLSQCVAAPAAWWYLLNLAVMTCGAPGTACGTNAACDASDTCACVPGTYATSQAPNAVVCSTCIEDHFCPGGPVATAVATACPPGSTSVPGSVLEGECDVPIGSWFNGTNVVPCPVDRCCMGGMIYGPLGGSKVPGGCGIAAVGKGMPMPSYMWVECGCPKMRLICSRCDAGGCC